MMAKDYSESTELDSKWQLREFRIQYWRSFLRKEGLDIRLFHWWTQEEKDLERTLWIKADEGYEANKLTLKTRLEKISPDRLKVYFKEIGVSPSLVADWLKPSLLI